jgi:lipoprotein Spr
VASILIVFPHGEFFFVDISYLWQLYQYLNNRMKSLFILAGFFCLLTACGTSKVPSGGTQVSSHPQSNSSVQFLDNISINGHREPANYNVQNVSYNKISSADKTVPATKMENYSGLQFKYAILENAPVEEMKNVRLLEFMDEWYGTEYHYGGTSKDGIDCSAFVALLMSSVYGIGNLPRISTDQFIQSRRVSKSDLSEGDLVFFHTLGKQRKVTHVGVYLRNNKFVHASISGVMISDMGEGYYSSHYVGAGRFK